MNGAPFVFTEHDYDTLKRRVVQEVMAEFTNKTKRLSQHGMRRHQEGNGPQQHWPVRFKASVATPAFAVMRVTGAERVHGVVHITTAKPSSTFQGLYLVNGPIAIGANKGGWGTWLYDAGFVLYDDANTPTLGQEWGPSEDSWEITRYRYGFTIVGLTSSGAVGAIQRQVTTVLAKCGGSAIASGSSGSITIYDGNQASMSQTLTATNRTGLDLDASTWCKATWLGGTWFVEPWECPA